MTVAKKPIKALLFIGATKLTGGTGSLIVP